VGDGDKSCIINLYCRGDSVFKHFLCPPHGLVKYLRHVALSTTQLLQSLKLDFCSDMANGVVINPLGKQVVNRPIVVDGA
jgi:hypothetical protein